MVNSQVNHTIKTSVHTIIPGVRILLFGSMARGNSNDNSDYDVLVITSDTLPVREQLNSKNRIRKSLVSALHAPVDVLLNSEEEVRIKKKLPGHVIRWAFEEGIEL